MVQARWSLVVPVKPLSLAKTRLGGPGGFAADVRVELALCFALDTVEAALASELVDQVLVVTRDPRAAVALRGVGATIVTDDTAGLNAAIALGIASAPEGPVGALCGDLAALRPGELTEVLATAQSHTRAVLGDRHAVGTTLLTALGRSSVLPAFGGPSLQAHVRTGATELVTRNVSSVRCDIDTVADLAAAGTLGLRRFTNVFVRNRHEPGP